MAKLVLSMDGLVLKEITLDRERLSIGRKPHNDVQIDNMAISGEHAAVVTILNDSFLEDLNSTNGTLVNGQPVKKCVLQHNDVIELGKYRLKYLAEPLRSAKVSAVGNEIVAAPVGDAAREPLPAAVIQLLSGPSAGLELDLDKPKTTLGKPGFQVAEVIRRDDGYFLRQVEGEMPLLINRRQIGQGEHRLGEGEVIELLGIKMGFFHKE